jgi:hypothetical protein
LRSTTELCPQLATLLNLPIYLTFVKRSIF